MTQAKLKNKTKELSIIIVSYNCKDYLDKCLDSIYRQIEIISFEVWVVDNNSSDGTIAMVSRRYPQVRVIANKNNPGFGRANNQALKKSRAKYILFLNPDTLVENNSLNKALNYIENHPKIGLLGIRLTDEDGRPQMSAARMLPSIWGELVVNIFRSPFPKSRLFGSYMMSYWNHKSRREVGALSGAFMLGRKSLLDKLGGFDENFFMYAEDVDLCYRLKKMGYKIYFLGDIKMIHYGAKSSTSSPASVMRTGVAGIEAIYHYFYKNRSPFYAWSFKVVFRFCSLIELLTREILALNPTFRHDEIKRTKIKVLKKIVTWDLTYET